MGRCNTNYHNGQYSAAQCVWVGGDGAGGGTLVSGNGYS